MTSRCLTCVATLLALAACGGAESAPLALGPQPEVDAPVELALRSTTGQPVFLGDLRGAPLLLFLFATFDGVSQAALRPLATVARENPDIQLVGIAVQPNPALLVDAYERALSPPFLVTYDPDELVVRGESALGPIEAVPSVVVLDARGRITGRYTGFPNDQLLSEMLDDARANAPSAPRRPPPLLGN